MSYLERTFQLTRGVGPWREKDLWARGLATWTDFERAAGQGEVMGHRLDEPLLAAIARARRALGAGDLPSLAALVPVREHWRLFPHFVEEAVFFDIEADGDEVPTVVGLMDRHGVATYRRGHTLSEVGSRLGESRIWVTFNGSAFDVPVLRRALEGLAEPLVHLDLRFLVRRANLKGGLKAVEKSLGLHRPPHLEGVRGFDAIRLWREWTINGSVEALRLLVEYNLYDAVNLRAVLEWTCWRIAELSAWEMQRGAVFERGDVLYDVSRLVLAQGDAGEQGASGRSGC